MICWSQLQHICCVYICKSDCDQKDILMAQFSKHNDRYANICRIYWIYWICQIYRKGKRDSKQIINSPWTASHSKVLSCTSYLALPSAYMHTRAGSSISCHVSRSNSSRHEKSSNSWDSLSNPWYYQNMQNMQNMHNMLNMLNTQTCVKTQNMHNIQNIQNMQGMLNMQNTLNTLNTLNMHNVQNMLNTLITLNTLNMHMLQNTQKPKTVRMVGEQAGVQTSPLFSRTNAQNTQKIRRIRTPLFAYFGKMRFLVKIRI